MNKNKIRKILVLGLIVCILLIIVLVIVNKKDNNKTNYYEEPNCERDYGDSEKIQISFLEYETIKNCIQQYVNNLNIENPFYYGKNAEGNYVKSVDDSEIKKNIIDLLSEEYIKSNYINASNLYDYIDTIKGNKIVIPVQLVKGIEDDVTKYKISVLVIDEKDITENQKMYFGVELDNKNSTFAVEPIKTSEEFDKYNLNEKNDYIDLNDNNVFSSETITEEVKVKEYFELYKYILLGDSELSYKLLNEEYKENRFEDFDDFKTYIKGIQERVKQMKITQYEINYDNDEYVQYICVNQYGDIFIFNESDTLDYNVILDEYTIDLPQFIEAYDKTNEKGKVSLNISKIVQALNAGDYEYMYNKLNDKFRENNYATLEEFEEYLESKLPKNIKIEYGNFSNEGTTYIYNLNITDLLGKSKEKVTMEIIMKLKDNRDFQVSFNIK